MKKFITQNKIATLALFLVVFLGALVSCTENLVYPDQDKLPSVAYKTTGWEIVDYSSQEDQGGEGDTGRSADILDGNVDTFWHTCWAGCTPTPPHHITVDMQQAYEVNGFYLVQRQSLSRNIESCEIQVSDDGVTWESVGEFTLEQIKGQQSLVLSEAKTFRYFKFMVKTVFDGSNNAALAELTPFISYN